ncbi:MAG: anthranilate/aminodeoxychorismate synthase component II [Candidatus Schekmanbacteria bacterium RBG_16_38_10]|uniref:Anthranilate/aminodeoxychorismate synthase component II n=1 Tax=Candidatus Schekmanbacteria bacterium RBG_16_38_10 TaxID=1817879 RepID=A0A1F7RQG1_9BACT|nr:MAG: anthranilate/aminodeoxychorismate synthase component II [Candidatus Schekmanbacteria bacterium RBG_16_38_10]
MNILIDNYDSFTYNLVQYFGELGESFLVFRNNRITVGEIEKKNPGRIVISPGPGTPQKAGITIDVIKHFSGKVPILGVCLGHQAIGAAYGAEIIQAKKIMHGKTSKIHHDGQYLFKNIPNPFIATRYHSLVIDKESLPSDLKVVARSDDDEIMGIRHHRLSVYGVQFHPESILTNAGKELLKNFLELSK